VQETAGLKDIEEEQDSAREEELKLLYESTSEPDLDKN
jgi:hypothetical protein